MSVLHETPDCDRQRHAARLARLARMSPKPIERVAQAVPKPLQVEEQFEDHIPVPLERINKVHKVNRIINAACRHFDMQRHELIGHNRKQKYAYPRHVAMFVARQTRESYSEIGRRFGNVDHSTVHHAVAKITRRMQIDEHVAADCEDLARAIGEVL